MRYEHLTLDLSTRACNELQEMLAASTVSPELENLRNELRGRLQHLDQDIHAALPGRSDEGWLDE